MGIIRGKTGSLESVLGRPTETDCWRATDALANGNAETRRAAVREMTDCPDASSVLVDHLTVETEPAVRHAILSALASRHDEVAIAGLIGCLRSDDAALRNEAVDIIGPRATEWSQFILPLLRDPDPDVRIRAIVVLEALRTPRVEEWLVELIERDSHVNVCATAVDVLAEVGSTPSSEPLRRLARRFAEEPYIQFAVDVALRRIEGI